MVPLQTTYLCSPLPHVAGSPNLRVIWANPTPYRPSASLLCWVGLPLLGLLQKVEPIGSPRFLMLLDTHATLFVNSDRPSRISPLRFLCFGFRLVNTLTVCFFNCLRSYIKLWGVRSPLRPMCCPVYASAISFGFYIPPP